jgi:hypothetical protein
MKKLLSLFFFTVVIAHAQLDLEATVQKHVKNYYGDLYDFMSLPSNAHIKEHIQPNLDWLKKAFEKQGFTTEALPTGGHPVFFAEKKSAIPATGPLKTLLVLHALRRPTC